MDATQARTRWANAFLYAIVTTVMVLSTAVLLSFLLGGSQRDLADRVDRNVAEVRTEAIETRKLLCDILANAETKQIRDAVEKYCPAATVTTP